MRSNWENTKLKDLLLYDKWAPYDAWCVLAGLDFEKLSAQKNLSDALLLIVDNEFEDYVNAEDNIERFRKWWLSGGRSNQAEIPEHFIAWALSKQFKPLWLNWAIENNLVKEGLLVDANPKSRILFDKDSPKYPSELDWAMQAWEAVRNDTGNRKPKTKVMDWLDVNAGDKLSIEAKSRIATVVNWDKKGGATRTG